MEKLLKDWAKKYKTSFALMAVDGDASRSIASALKELCEILTTPKPIKGGDRDED